MQQMDVCDLCGGQDFKFLFKNEDRFHGIPGEFSLWQCLCGLIFVTPRPDEKEIQVYYPNVYGASAGGYHSSISGKIFKKLQRVLIAYGFHWPFFRVLLGPLLLYVRRIPSQRGGRLLDVGCGSGGFLMDMKPYEMELYGIEMNPLTALAAQNQGLHVFQGSLEETNFKDEFFDVITLNHVFEHLHQPTKILSELKRILKKEGTLILGVPNARSALFKIFKKYWVHLDTPRHLYVHSLTTLQQYSDKLGFRMIHKRYQCSPGDILLSLENRLNVFRKKKVFGAESRLAANSFLKIFLLPIAIILSYTSFADSIEVWLKKR